MSPPVNIAAALLKCVPIFVVLAFLPSTTQGALSQRQLPSTKLSVALPHVPKSKPPPGTVDVFVAGEAGYFCIKIPDLIVTHNGTLIAFGEARKDNCSDYADTTLVYKRSFDNGNTWTPLKVLYAKPNHVVGNAAPVVINTGQVIVPFCIDNFDPVLMRSDDHGATWSPLEKMANATRPGWNWIGFGPPASLQLASGRIVIPSYHDPTPHSDDGQFSHVHLVLSDDDGKTWRIGAVITIEEDDISFSNECQVVEISDNRLLLNARTVLPFRFLAVSPDGGESFESFRLAEDLPEPLDGCEGSMLRHPTPGDGRLFFSNPSAMTLRFNMTLRVSHDSGATWSVLRQVDPGPSAYSALAWLPSAGSTHERNVSWTMPAQAPHQKAATQASKQRLGLLYERSDTLRIVFIPDAISFTTFDV